MHVLLRPFPRRLLRPLAAAALVAVALAAHAGVTGSWAIAFEGRQGTTRNAITLERTEDGFAGSITGQRGTRKLDAIEVDGDRFAFDVSMPTPMGTIDLRYAGTVSGDQVSGTISTPMGERPFTGKRKE